MDTHFYAGPGNVILADCDPCELNWLDHGKLMRIVHAPDHSLSRTRSPWSEVSTLRIGDVQSRIDAVRVDPSRRRGRLSRSRRLLDLLDQLHELLPSCARSCREIESRRCTGRRGPGSRRPARKGKPSMAKLRLHPPEDTQRKSLVGANAAAAQAHVENAPSTFAARSMR